MEYVLLSIWLAVHACGVAHFTCASTPNATQSTLEILLPITYGFLPAIVDWLNVRACCCKLLIG